MPQIHISIIVPTFNRSDSLRAALVTLLNVSRPKTPFEIIVIDNGSTDATASVSKSFESNPEEVPVRYVFDAEPGLLTGRHRGALEARGDVLVFIDDDIEAREGWLQAIEEGFADSSVQILGGPSLPKYESKPPAWLDDFWRESAGGRHCGELSLIDLGTEVRRIDPIYIWGLNFSIRKKALHELGGFHPDCMPPDLQHMQGDGETGLCLKARARGYKTIYHPSAALSHIIPAARLTPEYFDRRYFYQGVCDSYSALRRAYYRSENEAKVDCERRSLPDRMKRLVRRRLRVLNKYRLSSSLSRRFSEHHQAGFTFHQRAVERNVWLRDWVLRKDYWDYRIPRQKLK